MVVIDATILLLLIRPDIAVPAGKDGLPPSNPRERVDFLVERLHKSRDKIVIPTPALSEVLVNVGATATQQYVDIFQKQAVFQIYPFDTRAAIEVAILTRDAIAAGEKRHNRNATLAKIKYDRQIVAIAKVCGATTIYSDDEDIHTLAAGMSINVIGLAELPLPPRDRQLNFMDRLSSPASMTGDQGAEDENAPEEDPAG